MEENIASESTPSRFRPPQFQLAQATVIITAIAILLMFSAPWMRAFNQSQWMEILRSAICIFVGAIVFWTILDQIRRNAMLRAGGLLLVMDDKRSIRSKIWRSVGLVILCVAPIFLILVQVHLLGKSNPPTSWMLEVMNRIAPLVMTFQFIYILRSSTATQFRENGLLMGGMLLNWKNFKTYRWGAYQPNQLQLIGVSPGSLPIQVAPEQREQVEAILRTHLTGFIQSPETSHSED
ncbi:hypothetical protein M4951_06300 [Blastopirellula sp. J2-11]|uniref:hypothetical protein n=1 Tax=Blastopirellula sp. J2-11 TaxID=2943192 RepID=UPI0021C968E9|nr:hypothetical protein [Blastopirellula sp. J2-11]UUO07922.1 hypothetical protein M4951_06300 [Blastopirellula sp. J2-11]